MEKGGILLMPMKKNIPEGRIDWKPYKCPKCGGDCWKVPEADDLVRTQGVELLCTECGLKDGLG